MFSDMFYKLLLFMLHYAYSIFEFTCDTWVYLKHQIVNLKKHKKSGDFFARLKTLNKVPVHLTVLLSQEKPSYKDLAHLVIWSVAAGISFISFFEQTGILKKTEFKLRRQVEKLRHKADHIMWRCENEDIYSNGFTSRKIHVKVLSLHDGKDSIVNVCKQLGASELSENIDKDLLNSCLQKQFEFPDPDLAIYCGKTFCLYEYPPWQIRVTEFFNLKTHHDVQVDTFVNILERYSKCEQRMGK